MIGTGVIGCDQCEEPIEAAPVLLLIPNEGTDSHLRMEFCDTACLAAYVEEAEAEKRRARG